MHIGSAFSSNVPASLVSCDSSSEGGAGGTWFGASMAAAVCLLASTHIFASDEIRPESVLPDEAAVVRPATPELRRAELRQALRSDELTYGAKIERRRLSAEERNVLTRELRAAMRSAYDKRPQRTQ